MQSKESSARNQEAYLRQAEPVVVIGMHRSGTSLMAQLLKDVGVYMGHDDGTRVAEAPHFRRLNKRVYARARAWWGYVTPVVKAMGSPKFVEQQAAVMQTALYEGVGIADYFGPDLWDDVCRRAPVAWGWKDPRTTVTFPIWMQLFPNARLVHIIRNGVDVAISLHRRWHRRRREFWQSPLSIRGYRRLYYLLSSYNVRELGYCFHLWEEHVAFALEHKTRVPTNQYCEVRYENLVNEPKAQLRRVLDFLDIPTGEDILRASCERVVRSHYDNSRYAADYPDALRAMVLSPLMQQLGYDYDITSPGTGPG